MTATAHAPSRPASKWSLATASSARKHIELHAGHPDYASLMAARAQLVREWQDARAAGDSVRMRALEGELEFMGMGL